MKWTICNSLLFDSILEGIGSQSCRFADILNSAKIASFRTIIRQQIKQPHRRPLSHFTITKLAVLWDNVVLRGLG